jgi:hypothetical protein
MWWCCGKLLKEAPGCKFAKHECKEDEEEDDDEKEKDEEWKNKYLKCFVELVTDLTSVAKNLGIRLPIAIRIRT